ncbi:response regulator transcription factor [Stenotrophomonas indicatrix]|uniref:response regulator transcription factor n=1 Tax=Stenotrophomonas indicatrix TaxID=2045451 RepID=UPI0008B19082|nr:response regulator transcription factor [Stenotrophomonas indicatrix]SET73359.1 two-component system, NarL family, captular synthesis response regulator RcsB [Stenotrophomonas indicatrix]
MSTTTDLPATRVVIADDHALLRAGLSVIANSGQAFQVVGHAEGPSSLEAMLGSRSCDLLLIDLHMPQEELSDGLAMLARVRAQYPMLRVIVFTADDDPEQIDLAFACGIDGYVHKTAGSAELLDAMQGVMAGRRYLCQATRLRLARRLPPDTSPLDLLTACEADVLRLLREGLTLTGIAQLRKRTVATVSHQKISAMRRLGVNGDAELFKLLAGLQRHSSSA